VKAIGYLLILSLMSCQPSLRYHAKIRPFAKSDFFADQSSVRPPPEGAIARGSFHSATDRASDLTDDHADDEGPPEVSKDLILRGQQRFDIYCQVCHGLDGRGQGMAVLRDFPAPPSFHIDRLRQVPLTHFFDVITNGSGRMFGYANRIPPKDRWAIAEYVRSLQLQQHFPTSDLKAEDFNHLQKQARDPVQKEAQ
jgi:mono/diheme cytochrome c family protein